MQNLAEKRSNVIETQVKIDWNTGEEEHQMATGCFFLNI